MSDGAALIGALTYGLRAAGAWRDEREANLLDGGEPTYGVYRCLDGKFLALGAIEPQFRARLFKGLALARRRRAARRSRRCSRRAAATNGRAHFAGTDACVAPVLDLERSAGPSAQYRAAHLPRPRRRVPARAGAALFAHVLDRPDPPRREGQDGAAILDRAWL